ncbi:hypothetical protein RND71_012821 [Anisodus tanguticus]|uniref:Transcription repressor n=1 Tax=Anisodus tanguticus TaxID=243964 RepID=A0AAE1SE27_9SOLA|nr:hypothetical protein RND71_012821 [Anisodus tanguticus]
MNLVRFDSLQFFQSFNSQFDVSNVEIKDANGLEGDTIYAGKKLSPSDHKDNDMPQSVKTELSITKSDKGPIIMQNSKAAADKKQKLKGCSALRCSCRLSVSSSSEEAESSNSDRYPTISSLTHSMVQERLDKMIREREEAKNEERGRRRMRRAEREEKTKFIVMIAMEKSSYDPREDFRESIEQMIMANRIHDTKDLRRLLNYYVSMNAEEYRGIILEVFHEVCTSFFLSCKRPLYEQV